jgi:hypothetical protein
MADLCYELDMKALEQQPEAKTFSTGITWGDLFKALKI